MIESFLDQGEIFFHMYFVLHVIRLKYIATKEVSSTKCPLGNCHEERQLPIMTQQPRNMRLVFGTVNL